MRTDRPRSTSPVRVLWLLDPSVVDVAGERLEQLRDSLVDVDDVVQRGELRVVVGLVQALLLLLLPLTRAMPLLLLLPPPHGGRRGRRGTPAPLLLPPLLVLLLVSMLVRLGTLMTSPGSWVAPGAGVSRLLVGLT